MCRRTSLYRTRNVAHFEHTAYNTADQWPKILPLSLGLKLALPVFNVLEELNLSLQARNAAIIGMLQAVNNVPVIYI